MSRSFLSAILILTSSAAAAEPGSLCESFFSDVSASRNSDFMSREFSRPPSEVFRGLVSVTVPVTKESLVAAYSEGIFPFETSESGFGHWFNPKERGVMILADVKIGKSDWKDIKKLLAQVKSGDLRITEDQAFGRVLRECRAQERLRRDSISHQLVEKESWISDEIIAGYEAMFEAGHAHSVEIWRGHELVGGLYGTFLNGVFSGESMFHKESNVTKLAFWYSLQMLKAKGLKWVDTQVAVPAEPPKPGGNLTPTSLTVKWGAREVDRDTVYLPMLRESQLANLPWLKRDKATTEHDLLRILESEAP